MTLDYAVYAVKSLCQDAVTPDYKGFTALCVSQKALMTAVRNDAEMLKAVRQQLPENGFVLGTSLINGCFNVSAK